MFFIVGFHFLPPHLICGWYFLFSLTVYATPYTILVAVNFFHVPSCLACLGWFRAGPYHASTTIIVQVIILFKGRRSVNITGLFAKRVFMLFNVFYVSRQLIIDQLSFTWHAQHLRLQMQIESRCRFFLSLLFFFYSFLFHYDMHSTWGYECRVSMSFFYSLFLFSLFIQRLLPSLFL